MLQVAVGLQLLVMAVGFEHYQKEIPNGNHVPNPCWPNYLWHGVGHKNAQGGGERNPFGVDFAASGHKFTKELCEKDSDGDGRTNGEELGDPDCQWKKGMIPKITKNLTNPGICEPLNSTKCKMLNNWPLCSQKEYQCNDTEAADVKNITFQFPRTRVPPTETNYYCMLFDLPADRDYHIVGTKPLLDNLEVMHHIVVYGCNNIGDEAFEKFSSPGECSVMPRGACGTQIALWTLGLVGSCSNGLDAAVRFGNTSYTKVLMEFHWNNPRKAQGLSDSSGMVFYYTPKLRKYDLGTVATGQLGLVIPPRSDRVEIKSQCKSGCTQAAFAQPVNIVSVAMHMHYLGIAGFVRQYRNDTLIRTLAADDVYRYDSPVVHEFWPPVVLMPGDRLETTCIYKSTYKSDIVYFGFATADEMCFAFIDYYPKADTTFCLQVGGIDTCPMPGSRKKGWVVNGCNITDHATRNRLYTKLRQHCDLTGETCLPECKEFLTDNVHPCLDGDTKLYNEWLLPYFNGKKNDTKELILASRSCDLERLKTLGISPFSYGEQLLPSHMTVLLGLVSMVVLIKTYI